MAEAVLQKIRTGLTNRGTVSQRGLASVFRNLDNNGNKQIDASEMVDGFRDYGINITKAEAQTVIAQFDQDRSGSMNVDELLRAVRGAMNEARQAVVRAAFAKFDKDGSGQITLDDLKSVYTANRHPKVVSGEMTEAQVLAAFLSNFESKDSAARGDGVVTWDEFRAYYDDVSSNFENTPVGDQQFEQSIRNAWKL
jgi:Ca2+-binding EF-hand superfamily protein